ncbi:MAG: adenylate/guanylate cyclase domain-containing protein, partial [Alphaproteobacteria bacterium]
VVEATQCAVEVQRAMAAYNATEPEERSIEFRVGINLGDIIVDGDDIQGDGVNIAARLEALADPGGICIRRAVRNQVRDKLPYAYEDMGEIKVKNMARPIRVFRVLLDGSKVTAVAPVPGV